MTRRARRAASHEEAGEANPLFLARFLNLGNPLKPMSPFGHFDSFLRPSRTLLTPTQILYNTEAFALLGRVVWPPRSSCVQPRRRAALRVPPIPGVILDRPTGTRNSVRRKNHG